MRLDLLLAQERQALHLYLLWVHGRLLRIVLLDLLRSLRRWLALRTLRRVMLLGSLILFMRIRHPRRWAHLRMLLLTLLIWWSGLSRIALL